MTSRVLIQAFNGTVIVKKTVETSVEEYSIPDGKQQELHIWKGVKLEIKEVDSPAKSG